MVHELDSEMLRRLQDGYREMSDGELLGLAAKNSILLVEFAIEAERSGMTRRDALYEACRERARPIIMTTVAMMAGMLPTALGLWAYEGRFKD